MDREALIAAQNLAKFRELLGREIDPDKRRMRPRQARRVRRGRP
jgi:hypothetical protein